MTATATMKILLADDHALIRAGLKGELGDIAAAVSFVEAWDARSLEAALAAHDDLDLALVDLTMPGMDGVRSIAALRDRHPEVPLIVLSGVDAASVARDVLRAGAAGFIPKSAIASVVVSAIRLVLAGGRYVPPELLDASARADAGLDSTPLAMAPRNHEPTDAARLAVLTPRQRQVFALLARGLSNKRIASELNVSEGTIKTHVATIFDVLHVRNRVAAVAAARGLADDGDDPTGPRR